MTRLPDPIRQCLETLLREGSTARGAARQLGVAPGTVRAVRRDLGIPPHPTGQATTISPQTRASITALLHTGRSDVSIGRQIGVSGQSVGRIRRDLGIPPHTSGQAPAESHLPDTTRDHITDLLLTGQTDRGTARQLDVPLRAVRNLRRNLGIPPSRTRGRSYASLEDSFYAKAAPTKDGHLIWPGYEPGTPSGPVIKRDGKNHSVYRIAFRLAHRRDPAGHVTTGCGRFGCVHPEHVEDRSMRTQYNAIFGRAA